MADGPSLAFVHEWLTTLGGSERFLEAALELYPQAPLYTPIYRPEFFADSPISRREIHTSFIDRLPFARARHRAYIPLMPLAVEGFDLRGYDLIISSSHAVAHGVLPQPDQLHLNYIHSPARYAWGLYHQHMESGRLGRGPVGWAARAFLHYLRLWDFAAAARVDGFIANSRWVAQNVWRAYRRTAQVVYPPVRVHRFEPGPRRDEFYITVARLVPYKRVDLIVETFRKLGYPLIVAGDGPEYRRLAGRLPPNVEIRRGLNDEQIGRLMGRAKAFVYAAVEDFGIAPVEAQAAGCPVIAYGRGGLLETVLEGKTGVFYPEQSVESLAGAVRRFQEECPEFDPLTLRENAARFGLERFNRRFSSLVEREWAKFKTGNVDTRSGSGIGHS